MYICDIKMKHIMKTFLHTLSIVMVTLLLTSASSNDKQLPVAVRSTQIHARMLDQYLKSSLKEGYVVKEIATAQGMDTWVIVVTEKY